MNIHNTAIIENGAKIGNNVKIGAYSVIGPNVILEDNITIHSHVSIDGYTEIGAGTTMVDPGAGDTFGARANSAVRNALGHYSVQKLGKQRLDQTPFFLSKKRSPHSPKPRKNH